MCSLKTNSPFCFAIVCSPVFARAEQQMRKIKTKIQELEKIINNDISSSFCFYSVLNLSKQFLGSVNRLKRFEVFRPLYFGLSENQPSRWYFKNLRQSHIGPKRVIKEICLTDQDEPMGIFSYPLDSDFMIR